MIAEYSWSPEPPVTAVPWEDLRDAAKRKDFLKNARSFGAFKSLDPPHMGTSELYDVLNHIIQEQTDDLCLLEFNRKHFSPHKNPKGPPARKASSRRVVESSDDSDDEISEIIHAKHQSAQRARSLDDHRSDSDGSRSDSRSKSPPLQHSMSPERHRSDSDVSNARSHAEGATFPGFLPYATVEAALLEVARYEAEKQKRTKDAVSASTPASSPSKRRAGAKSSPPKGQEKETSSSSPSKRPRMNTQGFTPSKRTAAGKTITPPPKRSQINNVNDSVPSQTSSPSKRPVAGQPSPSKGQGKNTSSSSPSKRPPAAQTIPVATSPSKRSHEEDTAKVIEKNSGPPLKRRRIQEEAPKHLNAVTNNTPESQDIEAAPGGRASKR